MIHLFTRKLKLLEHLTALKKYALGGAGDTIDLFVEMLLRPEIRGEPTASFDTAVKMSS